MRAENRTNRWVKKTVKNITYLHISYFSVYNVTFEVFGKTILNDINLTEALIIDNYMIEEV